MNAFPDIPAFERARLARDPRFDGLFYTAVLTTGIYCRPVCPAQPPRPENVSYYPSAAAAEAAGYRPCLRCRPELSPAGGHWQRGDATLARALRLMDEGLDDGGLPALAARLDLSERQLRRLFVERLGAAPLAVLTTRRLLFAKQLLSETRLPITEVALAAGFGSLRRFNTAFRDAYGLAPSQVRKGQATASPVLVLRLAYRPPYDFAAQLDFLRGHALPGVEVLDDHSYARVIGTPEQPGWLRVSAWDADTPALRLELHGAAPGELQAAVARIRRMFDLDADPEAIAQGLAIDPTLAELVARRPGLRLPSGWDGFEIAVRAVIGQQVSVVAATTMTARVVQRFGRPWGEPGHEASRPPAGLHHFFPTVDALADAALEDLTGLGLIRARAGTLGTVARALRAGEVDFDTGRTLDDFARRWIALKGIGPWTAQYIALRALAHPDACPVEDLVLQKRLAPPGERLTAKALYARAEAWRPWRAYGVMQVWREATWKAPADAPAEPVPTRLAKESPR